METIFFEQVLSPQQKEIYKLVQKGDSYATIARALNTSKASVANQMKKIKEKKQDTKLPSIFESEEVDDIEQLFAEETQKHKKLTVAQAQFISNTNQMHSDRKKTSYYRNKTGILKEKTEVSVRVMSEAELEEARKKSTVSTNSIREKTPTSVVALERVYRDGLENNSSSIESMASLEIILRAYGLIYKTPYVNKLNRKTGEIMRAKGQGKKVINVPPDQLGCLPQGAKHIETIREGFNNEISYSVWIV